MAGLTKPALARLVERHLAGSHVALVSATFAYPAAPLLPWLCHARISDYGERNFAIYFWTIGHGGRTRAQDEYRIQTKLERGDRRLAFDRGTTLLLGYYRSDLDTSGRSVGNNAPNEMEVFAAWDALPRLRLGYSSSCQVPFSTLLRAHQVGFGSCVRSLPGGVVETVIAVPPRHLDLYMEHASLGHQNIDLQSLRRSIALRENATTP